MRVTKSSTIIILGGGAAGFFSAIQNKQNNPKSTVIIIEKNSNVLSKVKVSGGGRCNVTHACFDPSLLCENYPRGGSVLRSVFYNFQPKDTMDWFQSRGVKLKVESDNRVFPVTNSSQTIIDCLIQSARDLGIKIWTNCQTVDVKKDNSEFKLTLKSGESHFCQKLVLATGSHPFGYKLASQFGHTIIPPIASLFTFKIQDPALHNLAGISIDHVKLYIKGMKSSFQTGPILITHWGISGPSVIKYSAWQAKYLYNTGYKSPLIINWLTDLTESDIRSKLLSFQFNNAQKSIKTRSPFQEIPTRLWCYLLEYSKIPLLQWQSIQKKSINKLVETLTQYTIEINGKSPFKDEFVTCGGIDLKEINFKTMESKCCNGLFIIGELCDIDGLTGGFNFQNAWSTGYLSGQSIV